MKLKRLAGGNLNVTFLKEGIIMSSKGWLSDAHCLVKTSTVNNINSHMLVTDETYYDPTRPEAEAPDLNRIIEQFKWVGKGDIIRPTNLLHKNNLWTSRILEGAHGYVFVNEDYFQPFEDHTMIHSGEYDSSPVWVVEKKELVAVIMPMLVDVPLQLRRT